MGIEQISDLVTTVMTQVSKNVPLTSRQSRDSLAEWVGEGKKRRVIVTKGQGTNQSSLPVSKLPFPHTWYLELKSYEALNCHHYLRCFYVSSLGNGFNQRMGEFHVQRCRETWYFFLFNGSNVKQWTEQLRLIKTAPRDFGPLESHSSQKCPGMLRQPKMSSPKAVKFNSPMVPRHFCRIVQEESSPWWKKSYSNITESPMFEGHTGSGTQGCKRHYKWNDHIICFQWDTFEMGQ